MIIKRMMINICSNELSKSRNFYTELFDFKIDYESDWFIHLISEDKNLELGIIDINNQLVPLEIKNKPAGTYITFVVENVEELFIIAKSKNIEIIQIPEDTFYGQRRMLIKDPNNYTIDVSSLIKI